MDTQTILQMFKQAIKGGRGPEDEAYTAQRREFMKPGGWKEKPSFIGDAPIFFDDQPIKSTTDHNDPPETWTDNPVLQVNWRNNPHTRNELLKGPGSSHQVGTKRMATRRDWNNNPHTRLDLGPEMPMMGRQISAEEFGGIADQFAPQQVGTQRVGTQRDWSNNPHTRTDWGPELPMNGVPISAEEFGLADQFAPRFPGVDDQLHELFMQRNNRAMPGSPVNY